MTEQYDPRHMAEPSVSPSIRTAVYLGSLALSFASLLVFGLLGVFDVITTTQAAGGIAVVNGAVSVLAPLLASVYRPTRPDALSA